MNTTAPAPRRLEADDWLMPHDVSYLTTAIVNVVFVGEPNPGGMLNDWVLIDAGMPFNAGRIAAHAKERFGDTPPRAILLTHGHFDHIGSLHALLRRWPETPVYAHRLEIPYLTGHSAYPPADPTVGGGLMARSGPLLPHGPFNFRPNIMPLPADGVVPFLPDWKWIATPGHSPGHVSFFREADHALIAGDAFVTQEQESLTGVMTMKHVVHGPPMYFTPDWGSAKASVQRLMELKPRYAITGHGKPIANPVLAHDLRLLASRFDEIAVPEHGRYVHQAAQMDERGVVWVPPAVPDTRPKVIVGIALAALALGIGYRMRDRD